MTLIIASNNVHKIKEIRQILAGKFREILSLKDVGCEIDVVEDGDTFEANAMKKAREICLATGYPALADDTGLLVDALNGEPGVYSARYAGTAHDDAANNAKLLAKLEDVENRVARFETVVALYYPDGTSVLGKGVVSGRILTEREGENGFGYDSLFFCDELGKSFGSASDEEKNAVSHRYRALCDLLKKL